VIHGGDLTFLSGWIQQTPTHVLLERIYRLWNLRKRRLPFCRSSPPNNRLERQRQNNKVPEVFYTNVNHELVTDG